MSNNSKIYVAASSSEIDRAELWSQRLLDAGLEVVSTWTKTIRDVGDANPREASREQRYAWSRTDLDEVASADALWLLAPAKPTRGAWLEYGFAFASNKPLVASGDVTQSIFLALGHEFAEDIDAFTFIVKQAKEAIERDRAEIRKALDSYQKPYARGPS